MSTDPEEHKRLLANAGIGPLSIERIAEIAALRGASGRVVTASEIDAMAFELLDARDAAKRHGLGCMCRQCCPDMFNADGTSRVAADLANWDAAEVAKEVAPWPVATQVRGEGSGIPIPMRLTCPECGVLHIDEGEFATKVHHTHSCQECGLTWRPAVVPTVGVRFLPGFKSEV